MEVSIPANEVNTQYIYFADKKKNIIVDGDFIKILYSTESFEMNGLYIFVELEQQSGIVHSLTHLRVPEKSNITFSHSMRSDIAIQPTKPILRFSGHFSRRESSNTYRYTSGVLRKLQPALHKSSSSDSLSFAQGEEVKGQMFPTPFHIADAQSEAHKTGGLNEKMRKDTLQCSSNDDQANWIQITNNRNNTTKRVILFNPMSLENIALINRLCQIEQNIIERYIRTYCPFKIASYILKTQLMNGTIKYHSENVHIETNEPLHKWYKSASFDSILNANCIINTRERFILKISGVWETATNVGITMKFILVR